MHHHDCVTLQAAVLEMEIMVVPKVDSFRYTAPPVYGISSLAAPVEFAVAETPLDPHMT